MAEPTSSSLAAGFAATLSGVTMDLLGVSHLALVWGFVGAMMTMSQMEKMQWSRALLFGILSTAAGAAIGSASVSMLSATGTSALIIGSLAGGAGAFGIVAGLAQRFARVAGGEK